MLGLIGPLVKSLIAGELDKLLKTGFHTSIREGGHVFNIGAVETDVDDNSPLISSSRDAGELIGLLTVAGFEAAFEGSGSARFSVPMSAVDDGPLARATFAVSIVRL